MKVDKHTVLGVLEAVGIFTGVFGFLAALLVLNGFFYAGLL